MKNKRFYVSPKSETDTCLVQTMLCASPGGATPISGIGEPNDSLIPM